MNKAKLRKKFLEQRLSLTKKEREDKSQKIHDLLFSRLMMHRYDCIHTYIPFEKRAEVNTLLIIETLIKDFSPTLVAPKMKGKGEMSHVEFNRLDQLKPNELGILEPDTSIEKSHKEFFNTDDDILVLVPLLAFDKKGYRIGYGGGYYDRFLAQKTENTTTVGLSFFEPVEDSIATDEYDIPLDFCVTPKRVWSF